MSFTVRRVERNETHECLPVCLQREWRWGVWRTRPTGRPKPTEWWVRHSQHNRLLYVRFRLPMTTASLWASASVAQMETFVRTSADPKSRPCNYTLDVSNDADLKETQSSVWWLLRRWATPRCFCRTRIWSGWRRTSRPPWPTCKWTLITSQAIISSCQSHVTLTVCPDAPSYRALPPLLDSEEVRL